MVLYPVSTTGFVGLRWSVNMLLTELRMKLMSNTHTETPLFITNCNEMEN